MSSQREALVSLRCPADKVQPATHLRGTMIATSFCLAREFGFEEQYFSLLPSELHDQIRNLEPLSWVPMAKALAHYEVMNKLFPAVDVQIRNGRLASERAQNAHIKTLIKAVQATGQINPAVGLRRLPSVLDRMFAGGGAAGAYSVGPKDARIELFGYPVLDIPYIRNGWQGMFESALSLTAKRVFVKLDRSFQGRGKVAYAVSWV